MAQTTVLTALACLSVICTGLFFLTIKRLVKNKRAIFHRTVTNAALLFHRDTGDVVLSALLFPDAY